MGERKQDEKIRELIASAAQATEVFADDALEYAGYKTYRSDPAHLKPLTVFAAIPVASSVVNAARRGE